MVRVDDASNSLSLIRENEGHNQFARIDHLALLWLLNGDKLVELHRDKAILETASGARQTYRRRPVEVGCVVLAWELQK